jgi:hypothetical protein
MPESELGTRSYIGLLFKCDPPVKKLLRTTKILDFRMRFPLVS